MVDRERDLTYSCHINGLVFSGGSKGGARDVCSPPPGDPNSFNFMQFVGKFGKIVCLRPPGELEPPPGGNPGSATGFGKKSKLLNLNSCTTVGDFQDHQ